MRFTGGIDRRTYNRRAGTDPVTSDDLDEALAIHSEEERKYVNSLVDTVMSAFPDGVKSHCDYHKSKIEAAKAEKEFWDTAKKEVIKRGVGGFLSLLGILFVLAMLGASAKYGISIPFMGKP